MQSHSRARAGSSLQALFLACVLLAPSQALSPFPFLAACAILAAIVARQPGRLRPSHVALSILLLLLAAAGLALRFEWTAALRVLVTCLLIPLVGVIDLRRSREPLQTMSRTMLVSLVLCIVGFAYALLGGPPLARLTNPDGREALLFMSTLSNSVFPAGGGFLIRPSFIYDEPGAYAFVLDTLLLLRFVVNRRLDRTDYSIIAGGLITFSLAHIAVSVLLMFGARRTPWLALPAGLLVALDALLYRISDVSLIIDRFAFADGTIAGDNRSELLVNAIALLGTHYTGVGSLCGWDIAACAEQFGGFGENPVFPAAFYGLLPAAAYYVILVAVSAAVLLARSREHACAALATVLLIAQRPFLFSLGYNLQILLLFGLILRQTRLHLAPRRDRTL